MGDAISDTTNDDSVEAALTEYFLRRDRGQDVDLNEFISAYPGCEDELRKLVARERLINQAMAAGSPTAAPSQDLAGRTLGDFRLLRLIGRGGMGVVWEAEQRLLGRKVAVKLLPAALCADPRHRTRFQNEARILAQLAHPNIVSIIVVGEEADTYYFAMQYIDGITADDVIRLWSDKKAPHDSETAVDTILDGSTEVSLTQENGHTAAKTPHWIAARANRHDRYRQCARIASEVADGLAHAHACGVLHRDVKPSNILLDHSGTARLTDFGLARMYGDATLTATGTILGTLRYASPEQLGGTQAGVDERSDIYSLGATLWELVTGKRLFASEDRNSVITQVLKVEASRPSSLAVGLPRDLETIITRAMAKEPADRYASAQAFADDLRRFLDGRPIQAKPISLGERTFRWANRNRALTTAALGALVTLTAVAIFASGLILSANSRTATALIASRDSERKSRELHYAADMALAGAAWKKNEPAQVRMILDRYATPKTRADGSSEEDSRGFEWYFLDRQIRPSSELLFQNDKALYLVEFMPGGKEFFTAGMDSIVRWHDGKTGKVLRSLDTEQGEINCISYNSSATIFATCGDDGSVKIWNASDLTLMHSIAAYDGKCYFAKFLKDEMVITGGQSKVHRLFNAANGKLVREYSSPDAKLTGNISAASWDAFVSSAGDRFWTAINCDGRLYEGIYEWDVDTGESRRVSKDVALNRVLSDGSDKFLFVNTIHGNVRALDAKSGAERWSTRLDNKLEALALSPNKRRLVATDQNGQVYLWKLDLNNAASIVPSATPDVFSIHKSLVYGVAFAPDGESLVTTGRDGAVRRTRIQASINPFRELTWLRDRLCAPIPGTDCVAATKPLTIRKRSTGALFKTISTDQYQAVAVSSDGKLVSAGSGTKLGVWNLATGERMLNLDQKRRWTRSLDFSSNNSLIGVISNDTEDERIDVVDIATGRMERCTVPGSEASWAYFCPSDGLVARLSTPGQLVCWNVRDTTVRWETKPLEEYHHVGTISPDGNYLLTAAVRVMTLFDCATGEVRYRVPCEYPVTRLSFARDGRSFLVGGEQGQLSVWRADCGQLLFEIANIGTAIESIQPLQNGFLASTKRVNDGRTELVWLEF